MATLTGFFNPGQKPGDTIKVACAAVRNYCGGAAAVLIGTGYARPLVVTTDAMQFIGVYGEDIDNSGGSAGDKFVGIFRSGIFAFNMSGIVQASVGMPVWFSDDNTVTTTPGAVLAGRIVTIDSAGLCWVDISEAVKTAVPMAPQTIAASGALFAHASSNGVINKAGVAAMTLGAPTTGTDDGVVIDLHSSTANAHTLTATGLLQCGTASVNLATFAANAGAGLKLMAFNGKWIVLASVGITFS